MGSTRSKPAKASQETDDLKTIKALIKKYRAVFTTAGAAGAPLAFLKLVSPPPNYEELRYAAMFVTIVAFLVVIAYRDLIPQTLDERTVWRRPLPFLCGLMAVAGVFATTFYMWRLPKADLAQLTLYVFLWPLYVIPIAALLMFLYYQLDRRNRFQGALDQLSSRSEPIIKLINQFAHYEARARQNRALGEFGKGTLLQARTLIEGVMQGRITNDATQMPNVFAKLSDNYERFDAVSVRELPFWITGAGDSFARDYFKAGADMVSEGKIVTRIFVLGRRELEHPSVLIDVLLRHYRAGIGIAVVIYEQLPPRLRQLGDQELDFGLWDHGRAYSVFRQKDDPYRNIKIVFSLEHENCDVPKKVGCYKDILRHAWLVDERYMRDQEQLIKHLRDELRKSNTNLLQGMGSRVNPDGDFLFQAAGEKSIRSKIEDLIRFWNTTEQNCGTAVDEVLPETAGTN